MREMGRKPYIAKNYREMMKTTPNITVWNKLIEKHSEFEKPYLRGTNYDRMQYFHPIMPGLSPWNFDFDKWEFPFDPYNPSTWPWDISFFCHSQPCYCADEERCVDVGCAFPIAAIILRSGCEGMEAYVDGTQICIKAPPNPPFGCRIDIIQQVPKNELGLPEGLTGDHSAILVDECDDCCGEEAPLVWDYDSSAETIAPDDSSSVFATGGKGPYTWTVSGTDFSFVNEKTAASHNDLVAGSSSCGSAAISVTDTCGNNATAKVRSTAGTWSPHSSNVCEQAGEGGTVTQVGGTDSFHAVAVKDDLKQTDLYEPTGTYGADCNASIAMDCMVVASYCFNASWTRQCADNVGCQYVDPEYEDTQKFQISSRATEVWECT